MFLFDIYLLCCSIKQALSAYSTLKFSMYYRIDMHDLKRDWLKSVAILSSSNCFRHIWRIGDNWVFIMLTFHHMQSSWQFYVISFKAFSSDQYHPNKNMNAFTEVEHNRFTIHLILLWKHQQINQTKNNTNKSKYKLYLCSRLLENHSEPNASSVYFGFFHGFLILFCVQIMRECVCACCCSGT